MTLAVLALTLLAGAVGAVLRASVVAALPRSGTGLVNVAGTMVLAVCTALAGTGRLAPGAAAVVGLGLAGSLTTFSGWIARVDGAPVGARVLVTEVLLPLGAGVGVTVGVLVALG